MPASLAGRRSRPRQGFALCAFPKSDLCHYCAQEHLLGRRSLSLIAGSNRSLSLADKRGDGRPFVSPFVGAGAAKKHVTRYMCRLQFRAKTAIFLLRGAHRIFFMISSFPFCVPWDTIPCSLVFVPSLPHVSAPFNQDAFLALYIHSDILIFSLLVLAFFRPLNFPSTLKNFHALLSRRAHSGSINEDSGCCPGKGRAQQKVLCAGH